MLRVTFGVTRMDRIRNVYFKGTAHVCLRDKVREARLSWSSLQKRDSECTGRRKEKLEQHRNATNILLTSIKFFNFLAFTITCHTNSAWPLHALQDGERSGKQNNWVWEMSLNKVPNETAQDVKCKSQIVWDHKDFNSFVYFLWHALKVPIVYHFKDECEKVKAVHT